MSFEVLKQIIEENKLEPNADAEELAEGQCYNCWWPLKTNDDGITACEMCGRIFR